MAVDVQVTCIIMTVSTNYYERIHSIGGRNADGGQWTLTEVETIRDMKAGKYTFFTKVNGIRANVRIGWHHVKNEYLTTEPDGYQPNNLLSLKDCRL